MGVIFVWWTLLHGFLQVVFLQDKHQHAFYKPGQFPDLSQCNFENIWGQFLPNYIH